MLPPRLLSLLACLALTGAAAAAPPTLTTIDVIDGANEDQNTSISYATLAAAADEADADSDPIEFRFESAIAGTLRKNGNPVNANGTLGTGETWVWTPPANANGVIDAFRVRAFANGQESATDIVVRIDVTAVNDAPTITATFNGTSTSPFLDTPAGPVGESGPAAAQAVFSAATIGDVDHNKPNPDNQVVVVTIPTAAETYGTFSLPGSTVASVPGGKTYTLPAQSPANAAADLLEAKFTPLANANPVGLYNFDIGVTVRDSTSRTDSTPSTAVHVRSVNDSPTANASLAVASITDAGPVSPFRLNVNDVDFGESFSVSITETGTDPRGTLSATTVTGNAAQIAAAIQALVYTPFQQGSNVSATFEIEVTDVHPDSSSPCPATRRPSASARRRARWCSPSTFPSAAPAPTS